jgi:glycosyltransferase involved in cell wall biosynthesis
MISVIIATHNEEKTIRNTIRYVYAHASYKRLLKEIIVVDGGSTDGTIAEAQKTNATIMCSTSKGRAAQFNDGAKQASGKVLYFLQSHLLPPDNFIGDIAKAYSKGYAGGTFSLKFDYRHWALNTLSWLTNNASWLYLSDQSLFVAKELFDKAGGFREDHLVMANQEIITRIKRYTPFIVIKDSIISSTGRYLHYGIFKTQALQTLVYFMHKMGYSQKSMTRLYRIFLRWEIGSKPAKVLKPVAPSLQTEKGLTVASQ